MSDEDLAGRLRDLALVDLDALGAGLVPAFADDVAHALGEARTRLATLRQGLAGDALAVIDAADRTSEVAAAGAARTAARLTSQAESARALARLSELSAGLVTKLFEAARRVGPKNP